MNIINVPLADLEVNKGQIKGLPRNPRFIKDNRFNALKKSITDDPEMLELREAIVFFHKGKYVIIGGNMRYRVCKDLGMDTMPCKVLDPKTPIEKLRAYAIKDNVAFGDDDMEELANEWDIEELKNFGMQFNDFGSKVDEYSTDTHEDEQPNAMAAIVEKRCPHCGEPIN